MRTATRRQGLALTYIVLCAPHGRADPVPHTRCASGRHRNTARATGRRAGSSDTRIRSSASRCRCTTSSPSTTSCRPQAKGRTHAQERAQGARHLDRRDVKLFPHRVRRGGDLRALPPARALLRGGVRAGGQPVSSDAHAHAREARRGSTDDRRTVWPGTSTCVADSGIRRTLHGFGKIGNVQIFLLFIATHISCGVTPQARAR